MLPQQQQQQLYFLTWNIQISHHLQIARLIEAGGVAIMPTISLIFEVIWSIWGLQVKFFELVALKSLQNLFYFSIDIYAHFRSD